MLQNLLLLAVVTIFSPNDAGTTAFPLLKVQTSPRACAMGEAFVGFANDPSAIFWNPGGLGQLTTVQLNLGHHEWFGGIRDENAALAIPLGPGCLGIGTVFSTVRDIEIWDPLNNQSAMVTARSGYAVVGYGMPVIKNLSCGLSVKGLYDDLIEQTGKGVCGDVGVLYQPLRRVRVGLAAQNLGWGMNYGGDNFPLPAAFRLGASYEHPRFRVLFDANAPIDNQPDFHLGGEYTLREVLALRAGYRLGPQDWRTLSWTSGITAGLGINLSIFSLDYAFVPYGDLGLTHRLALRTTFRTSMYGRVRIKVNEFKTGQPVTAKFILHGTHQGNSYTEPDGTFVVEGVEPGWLKVTATADRFYPTTDSVLVEARTTHLVKLAVHKSGYGSIWGLIHDAVAKVPVRCRVDYAGPEKGTTETGKDEGSFLLRKLKAGEYDFVVTPLNSAYAGQTATITVPPGELTNHTFLLNRLGSTAPADIGFTPVTGDAPPAMQPGDFIPLEESPAPETESLPPAEPQQPGGQ